MAILDTQRNCSDCPFIPIVSQPLHYKTLWALVPLENQGRTTIKQLLKYAKNLKVALEL